MTYSKIKNNIPEYIIKQKMEEEMIYFLHANEISLKNINKIKKSD